jgi:hypothetical protein
MGGGTRLQSTLGIVRTGPAVLCANIVATLYDQSHAMMVPGAVDVLPLNVQSIVLPLFTSRHVSDCVGPVTPKLAVAIVGWVTESTADADAPPYDPMTVPAIVPPTVLVEMMNVALVDPAGTVTFAGTMRGSAPESETTAPPAGAAAVRVAVPVAWSPPTTVEGLKEIEASAADGGLAVTVSVGD